ncbi:MAG: hypothetical protein HY319_13915 [Armatimonadetes bacterium]|nr:hypothetical protein [Armatimonadota bacterium]
MATQARLAALRGELKADIEQVREELKTAIDRLALGIDARLEGMGTVIADHVQDTDQQLDLLAGNGRWE